MNYVFPFKLYFTKYSLVKSSALRELKINGSLKIQS